MISNPGSNKWTLQLFFLGRGVHLWARTLRLALSSSLATSIVLALSSLLATSIVLALSKEAMSSLLGWSQY